jgi:uncharacterized membrane protein
LQKRTGFILILLIAALFVAWQVVKQFFALPSLGSMTLLGLQVTTDWISILLLVVFSASLILQWVALSFERRRFLLNVKIELLKKDVSTMNA